MVIQAQTKEGLLDSSKDPYEDADAAPRFFMGIRSRLLGFYQQRWGLIDIQEVGIARKYMLYENMCMYVSYMKPFGGLNCVSQICM